MANPQTEKGYTRLANEILMHIMKLNLNGTQFRIVIAIWRYTYGFQRKTHKMPLDFIADLIDSNKGQVKKALDPLIKRKIIITIDDHEKGGRLLSFNKNYEEWDSEVKPKIPDEPKTKAKSNKKAVKPIKYTEDNTYFKMATHFHKLVVVVAKESGVEHLIAKANLQNWADEFRKLVELDGVNDKKQILALMKWVTQDDFWKTNILSANKFRKKYVELAIKMKASSIPKQPQQKTMQQTTRDKDIALQKWVAEGNDPDDFNWTT